jgi:hypothetical protein
VPYNVVININKQGDIMKLLTQSSAKLDKSQNDSYLNAIMYLDPNYNKDVCKGASKGCKASCLINSGRMLMPSAVNARKERTRKYFEQRSLFMMQLQGEIAEQLAKAERQGKKLAIRLNGTSDIDWTDIYKAFPMVQFYEYTKRVDLIKKLNSLDNVHVTFSKHEKHTPKQIKKVMDSGNNIAVVFIDTPPSEYLGYEVVNGDKHDRRFEDKQGKIIGLKLKGTNAIKQLAINTGFAI